MPALASALTAASGGSAARHDQGPPGLGASRQLCGATWQVPSMFVVHVAAVQLDPELQFGPPSVARITYVLPPMASMDGASFASVAAVGVPPLAPMCPSVTSSALSA